MKRPPPNQYGFISNCFSDVVASYFTVDCQFKSFNKFFTEFFFWWKKWNFNFGWGEYNGRNSLKKSSWIRYLLGGAALLWLLVDVTDKSKKTLTFLTVPMWFRTIGKKSIAKVAWLSDTSLVQTHNTHVRWRTMRVSVWCTQ